MKLISKYIDISCTAEFAILTGLWEDYWCLIAVFYSGFFFIWLIGKEITGT